MSEVVSVHEEEEALFGLYPNPVNDFINIEGEGFLNINIVTFDGDVVLFTDEKHVDCSELTSGVYFAVIERDGAVETIKFLKN